MGGVIFQEEGDEEGCDCPDCAPSKAPQDITVFQEYLERGLKAYTKPIKFKVGDLVTWRQGCQTANIPQANVPAIVLQYLEKPLSMVTPGGTYAVEDILLGVIMPDGAFVVVSYPSWRFEKFVKAAAVLGDYQGARH